MMKKKTVRTRFAPSPTGFMHVGSAYQALLDYAFAKKNQGKFILRIEDTDQKRKVPGAEKKIYQALEWLGLEPDESPQKGGPFAPYRQSERLKIYRQYAEKLVKEGKAYYCFCSPQRLEKVRRQRQRQGLPPMYDGHCRHLPPSQVEKNLREGKPFVIRLKVPRNKKIVVNDLLRGEIVFDSNMVDDQVLIKSDGFPTYHLASVVDDHLMEITHVIRGEEWLSSAPKHILLYQYFGWEPPVFVHTPILRNPDRSKMSKREGHTSLFWYKKEGFLPEALLNFLALLGWSHPQQKEIFSLKEFISLFDLKDVSPLGPVFDLRKLEWMNGEYIRQMDDEELGRRLKEFLPRLKEEQVKKAVPLVKERIKKLKEAEELLAFVWEDIDYPKELLLQRGTDKDTAILMLKEAKKIVEEKWGKIEEIRDGLLSLIKEKDWNTGAFFMVFRVAICGKTITPPIVESLELLGKERVIERINAALEKLKT